MPGLGHPDLGLAGHPVRLWDCSGAAQQQWQTEMVDGERIMLVSVATGRVLDADRNVLFQNGTEVQTWGDWHTSEDLNQQWFVTVS